MRCNRFPVPAAALAAAASLALAGCGLLTPDSGPTVEYREAESTKSLEVPPDLTRPERNASLSLEDGGSGGTQSASIDDSAGVGGSGSAGGVLPEFEGVRFVRAGGSSWLEVDNVPPDRVWPRIDRFLRSQGLPIARSEPTLGIIETGWAARYDGPKSGGIKGFFDDLVGNFTSGGVRDRFNFRLERMEQEGTRIFVGHEVAQEVDTEANTRREPNFEWARRQGNPSVEAEMARRLLVYLGVSEPRSDTIVADAADPLEGRVLYQVDAGKARVMVGDPDPRRVFARVGDALNRMGAQVRSAEPERGVYVFDWRPPEGAVDDGGLFGLFGGGEPEARRLSLRLFRESGTVRIKAANEDGPARSGDVHRALLRQLAVSMGADEALVQRAEERDGADTDEAIYEAPERPPM